MLPTSLNSGAQVDQMIAGITAAYYAEPTFDTLPTPFKMVAVDLRTAQPVILERGSLARSMRATMSLPGIFPPVEMDGRVLVDGGAMNNVPADVVRSMGAQTVIAVNVGDLADHERINYSILGLAGATIDAMMRANTRKALTSADVVLTVPLQEFGSLDWRKSDALIEAGYQAAESMRASLLPFAVSDTEWQQWLARRASARKTIVAQPAFVALEGVGAADTRRMQELLAKHVGVPLDIATLERDLEELSGLDRYETILWSLTCRRRRPGRPGRQRHREAVRAAVLHAGAQPREHHLGPVPVGHRRALPAIRRARLRQRASPRRGGRRRIPASARRSTGRSGAPRLPVSMGRCRTKPST